MRTLTLTARAANRLDKALASLLPDLSRSAAQRLIDAGAVRVNGVVRESRHMVQAGDTLEVTLFDAPKSGPPQPEAIALDVLYEDDALLVINKPAGLVAHPGAGNDTGTLVNAVLNHDPGIAEIGDEARPGIVHRLDKETSGVMLIARTAAAYAHLQGQFKARTIHKTYIALCIGDVQPPRGVIDRPIGRDPANRQRMAVVKGGRQATTEFVVTERLSQDGARYTLLRAMPRTGRTHQIRVHLASLGHPIAGDLLYGAKRDAFSKRIAPRHCLHASELRLIMPATGEERAFYAPLPPDMRGWIEAMKHVDD